MVDKPGRYVLAAPRVDLLDEQAEYLSASARAQGRQIQILPIHSQRGVKGNVGRRVHNAL